MDDPGHHGRVDGLIVARAVEHHQRVVGSDDAGGEAGKDVAVVSGHAITCATFGGDVRRDLEALARELLPCA